MATAAADSRTTSPSLRVLHDALPHRPALTKQTFPVARPLPTLFITDATNFSQVQGRPSRDQIQFPSPAWVPLAGRRACSLSEQKTTRQRSGRMPDLLASSTTVAQRPSRNGGSQLHINQGTSHLACAAPAAVRLNEDVRRQTTGQQRSMPTQQLLTTHEDPEATRIGGLRMEQARVATPAPALF